MTQHIARIKALGLTVERFCYLTGYHPITVYNWGKVRGGRAQYVPEVVERLLEAWEAHPEDVPQSLD